MSSTSRKLDVTDSLNFYQYNRSKISHCALNFYFFNVREADFFFFMCLVDICLSLLVNYLFVFFLHVFLLGCLSFLVDL